MVKKTMYILILFALLVSCNTPSGNNIPKDVVIGICHWGQSDKIIPGMILYDKEFSKIIDCEHDQYKLSGKMIQTIANDIRVAMADSSTTASKVMAYGTFRIDLSEDKTISSFYLEAHHFMKLSTEMLKDLKNEGGNDKIVEQLNAIQHRIK